ncbi:hypothetical protein E5E36_06915 [Helicobacter pylori]|nr:hypothetical protein E5E36_06915 [Helicobacter pylori]WRG66828.1 hypothetical protein E5E31_06875 [Helicobacter pylori]
MFLFSFYSQTPFFRRSFDLKMRQLLKKFVGLWDKKIDPSFGYLNAQSHLVFSNKLACVGS